jgi:hypothetical protein
VDEGEHEHEKKVLPSSMLASLLNWGFVVVPRAFLVVPSNPTLSGEVCQWSEKFTQQVGIAGGDTREVAKA